LSKKRLTPKTAASPRGGRIRCKSTQNGSRLPSPARPAVGNSDRSIAGEGRGWGDNELSWSRLRVVRREARLRKAPHPAFGHLPPGGEGSDASRLRTEAVSPLPRDRLWGTATAQSRGRGGGGGTASDRHRQGDRRKSAPDSRPVPKASTLCPQKKSPDTFASACLTFQGIATNSSQPRLRACSFP
jgi:hypothetical protein